MQNQPSEQTAPQYTYERNCPDGVFDRMAIVGPEGEVIANLYFWDEPDTDEAKRVEKAARIICKHLNHWWHGMDDCRTLTPEEVREHERKRAAFAGVAPLQPAERIGGEGEETLELAR